MGENQISPIPPPVMRISQLQSKEASCKSGIRRADHRTNKLPVQHIVGVRLYSHATIQSLGIARANIFTRPRDVGFSTPDFPEGPMFDPSLEQAFRERLFALLRPNMPSRWPVYFERECEQLSPIRSKAAYELWRLRWGFGQGWIPPRPTPNLDMLSMPEREELRQWVEKRQRKWMNAACDVEGLFIHISLAIYTTHPEHAVFVTSDKHFHRQTKLDALRAINFLAKSYGQLRRTSSSAASQGYRKAPQ
jgi:hypothetical protein